MAACEGDACVLEGHLVPIPMQECSQVKDTFPYFFYLVRQGVIA